MEEEGSSSSSSPVADQKSTLLVLKGCARQVNKGITTLDFCKTLTHLHLANLNLKTGLDTLAPARNVKTIYIYNNKLTTLAGLHTLPTLTHIYAQDNSIAEIGFRVPPSLQFLQLNNNRLGRLPELTSATGLQELHLRGQRLEKGGKLEMDRDSIWTVAQSLRVLDLGGNGLLDGDLTPLVVLGRLERLDLSENNFQESGEIRELLLPLPMLHNLRVDSNPLCSKRRWRDALVRASESLRELNGQQINPLERKFLVNLEGKKTRLKQPRPRPPPRDSKGLPRPVGEVRPRRPATIDSRACHELSFQGPPVRRPARGRPDSARDCNLPRGYAGPWTAQTGWHGIQQ